MRRPPSWLPIVIAALLCACLAPPAPAGCFGKHKRNKQACGPVAAYAVVTYAPVAACSPCAMAPAAAMPLPSVQSMPAIPGKSLPPPR